MNTYNKFKISIKYKYSTWNTHRCVSIKNILLGPKKYILCASYSSAFTMRINFLPPSNIKPYNVCIYIHIYIHSYIYECYFVV